MPESNNISWFLGLLGVGLNILAGINLWIINGINKTIAKIETKYQQADEDIEAKVDKIISDRSKAWIDKEKDCGIEKAERESLKTRVDNLEKKR